MLLRQYVLLTVVVFVEEMPVLLSADFGTVAANSVADARTSLFFPFMSVLPTQL